MTPKLKGFIKISKDGGRHGGLDGLDSPPIWPYEHNKIFTKEMYSGETTSWKPGKSGLPGSYKKAIHKTQFMLFISRMFPIGVCRL